ncbi:F-box protein SKIP23-like [Carex rostrata]
MVIPGERSGIDGVLSYERNWSELPGDIIHLFSKKLPDISDFIRFRAVCKSWQLSAPVTDPPPQLPWLLEIHKKEHHEKAIVRFYCLSSGKVHTLSCPGSWRAWLQGPTCRYLRAYHKEKFEMCLLNPLIHYKIHVLLKPLIHDEIHVPDVVNCGGFFPLYIGPDPNEGGDIVVLSGYTNKMAFWRPRADDWDWVYVEGVGKCYSGNACYMGQYFSNDMDTGITNVIDIATKKLAYQIAPPEGFNPLGGDTVTVKSGGKILLLFQYDDDEPCHFDIYCLYFGDGEGKPCWVKITDIGDQMLFLQYNSGLAFSVSNFARFKGNCIYFMKSGRYLCRYDIGDGTTEVLPCPFDYDSVMTWFVPCLM